MSTAPQFPDKVLRAAFFLPQYEVDKKTGEMQGLGAGFVGIEMTHVLAKQLGITAQFRGYPNPALALAALQAGECNLAYMGIEPTRQAALDFSPAAFEFEYTYLIPAGSDIKTIADADRPGTIIAAVSNHASTKALAAQIKHAKIIVEDEPDKGFELLRGNKAQVFAMPREFLPAYCEQLPDSKILDDRFGVNSVGIAIAKGQTEFLTIVSDFVEDAKKTGLIADLIKRGKLPYFRVAPAIET